jgi:hypothetical protein
MLSELLVDLLQQYFPRPDSLMAALSNQELPQEFHLGHMMLGKPTAMGLSTFDAQRI